MIIKQRAQSIFKIVSIILMMVVASCVPSSGGSKKKQGTSSEEAETGATPNAPEFTGSLNFYQQGANSSSTSFVLPTDSVNTFYVRGEQIDSYIKSGNTTEVQCLVHYFPSSLNNKLAIWAAKPKSFLNLSTQQLEYYYLVSPSNTTENQSFCLKAGLITKLATEFGIASSSFNSSSICPSCGPITLTSNNSGVYSSSGFIIPSIDISYISFKASTSPTSSGGNGNLSCSSSAQCTSQGLDCCSNGQCVNDKQVKSSTDVNSSEYIQSLVEIATNPNAILSYSHLYHLCSNNSAPTPAPTVNPVITPTPTPEEQAQLELIKKMELYECLNPIEGELSYCTKSIENFTTFTGTIETGADDRNFSTIYSGTAGIPQHSIEQISIGGELLYNNDTILNSGLTIAAGNTQIGNDTLTDTLVLGVNVTPQDSAINDTLKIKYKVDGSCERVGTTRAICYKEYIQGQNLGLVTDHFPASNTFILPIYADTSLQITTEVDDVQIPLGSSWSVGQAANKFIQFQGATLQVLDTQKVRVKFYVDLASYNVLQSKDEALTTTQAICGCIGNDCNLSEVKDSTTGQVVNYACVYPQPDLPPPPLSQTVYLSAKSAPHRYFDQTGVPQDDVNASTVPEEATTFSYINGDKLKPNNVSTHIGFGEIYGRLGYSSSHAFPSKMVRVEVNKTYDITSYNGGFSNCRTCGNDYYSLVAKLFPSNFTSFGGGYEPNLSQTQRKVTSNEARADDLIFGRACFVPATMIPWSHKEDTDRQSQRKNRLSTQHFLFANGYQRDWYGFDYGSIIGSFDGVSWFAIGEARRIKAKSNKLYLAVNAYFSDLTVNNTYTIRVNDMILSPSSTIPTTDIETTGAQCQKVHECSVDRDCAAKLGWEYTCEQVSGVKSIWPQFDSNGLEKPFNSTIANLFSLVSNASGTSKRCVYRGRGAPCSANYNSKTSTNSYNTRTDERFHGCAPGFYCQEFYDGGTLEQKFNTKIARYARSVANQNASSVVAESDLDTFGKGARTIGRPYNDVGTESIPVDITGNLINNKVSGICLPGKDPEEPNDTFLNQMIKKPSVDHLGDHVTGIGMTATGNSAQSHYLSSCGVFNETGNYLSFEDATLQLNDPLVTRYASSQVIPSNSLAIFSASTTNLLKNFNTQQITTQTLEENRCLRAPGTTCHTNLDCSANKFITDKIGSLNASSFAADNNINLYEVLFWQEKLICSQAASPEDAGYDLTNNKCCREVGNTITIESNTENIAASTTQVDAENIPGVSVDLNAVGRYSRNSTLHYQRQTNASIYPELTKAADDACGSTGCVSITKLEKQFNSINEVAAKTCCSNTWVRSFDSSNGGGHKWGPDKTQVFDKSNFRCLNWQPKTVHTSTDFSCSDFADPDDNGCNLRSIGSSEASQLFKWLGKIELSGIPQIAIDTGSVTIPTALECKVAPTDQALSGAGTILPGVLNSASIFEYTNGTNEFASMKDLTNLHSDKKKVFSENEFNCCLPLGSQMEVGDNPTLCCSGNINPDDNRCALKNYSNVSLYFNKYVSSEANGLDKNLFDNTSGYLKDPSLVETLVCERQACASGMAARGVARSALRVPGHEGNTSITKVRYIDSNNDVRGLSKFFDDGLKWNDHVYCLPEEFSGTNSEDLRIINCSGN